MKIQEIDLTLIKDNPYQIREDIDRESLKILAKSIRERGLINPITLLKDEEEYIIVNSHRRFNAFKILKIKKIPSIVKLRNSNNELKIDLVHENLIREDLTPIEKSKAIKLLLSEIKSTKGDVERMKVLLNMLRGWKNNKSPSTRRKEITKSFNDDDIFHADKILKSIGVGEVNAILYLNILNLPKHMRKRLSFKKSDIQANGKLSIKQAEQIVRVKDKKYQEYLFKKSILGATANSISANVNSYLKKLDKGEWEEFTGKKINFSSLLKDDLKVLNSILEDCRRLGARIGSFKINTLIKLEETFEKEEFKNHLLDLKKQLELLLNKVNKKLEDKGYYSVGEDVETFEIVLNYEESRKGFRYTLPVKICKKLNIPKKGRKYIKLKIVGIKK